MPENLFPETGPPLATMYATREDDPAHACQCLPCRQSRAYIAPLPDNTAHLDEFSYDADGYDANGYNRDGYNEDGYNEDGYNEDGYDANGYNEDGYDANGYDMYGYDMYGYNEDGYNEDGYDADGYDADGYDANGYDADGYDADGYNEDGYDADGYNRDGDAYCPDCECAPCECNNGDECYCYSPQQSFKVRNDGYEPLTNDTRTTITLPAGLISEEGLKAISRALQYNGIFHYRASSLKEKIGDQWQTKTGNFTKRLSRHAYNTYQTKITPEILSQIGNIARDHSTPVSTEIDITRDLNQPASEFYHEDSCWWSSYSESRCTLKTNGGFGLRSFNGYRITGRAWVMPLRQTECRNVLTLTPTFVTMTPDAFVVFNGYGTLSGYTAARIMAHMSGWTYRKIEFSCSPMWINGDGYLIAPEDIAKDYTEGNLSLSVRQHSDLFEKEQNERERESVNA